MKRILSLVLALVITFGTILPNYAETTTDSQAGKDLMSYGIITGTENGLDETTALTRAMMATILADLYGKKKEAAVYEIPSSFTDVPDGKWFSKFIAYAEHQGWMIGEGNGLTFRPDDTMTTQEVNAAYLKALGYDVKWEEVNTKASELKMAVDAENPEKVLRGEAFSAMRSALDVSKMGTTEAFGTSLALTDYVAPIFDQLEVSKVIVDNSKTVVIEFNQELSEESVNTSNIIVTGLTISKVLLSENNKTVTLDMSSSIIAQSEEIEIIINNVTTADEGFTLVDYKEKFVVNDVIIPVIESISVIDAKHIKIQASEPINFLHEHYRLLPGIEIDENDVFGKIIADNQNFTYTIELSTQKREGSYKMTIEGLEDYSGLVAVKTEFTFNIAKDDAVPVKLIVREIVILPTATAEYLDFDEDGEIDRIIVTTTDGNITEAVQGDFTLAGDDLTITGISVINNVATITVTGQTDVTLTDDTLAWTKGAFMVNGAKIAARTAATMTDKAKPQVKSITSVSDNAVNTLAKEDDIVTYTVNFTEPVTVSDVTATTFTNAAGVVSADLDATAAVSDTILVAVNAGDNGVIDINTSAFTITDANSNVQTYADRASVNAHTTIPTTVTADTIAPAATLDIATDVNGVFVNKATNNITITAVGHFEVGLVVDVTKITIDTEDDNSVTPNVTLAVSDVLSISSIGNSVMIQLNGDGTFNVDAVLAAFRDDYIDSLDCATGWLKDAAGNEIPLTGVGTITRLVVVLN